MSDYALHGGDITCQAGKLEIIMPPSEVGTALCRSPLIRSYSFVHIQYVSGCFRKLLLYFAQVMQAEGFAKAVYEGPGLQDWPRERDISCRVNPH